MFFIPTILLKLYSRCAELTRENHTWGTGIKHYHSCFPFSSVSGEEIGMLEDMEVGISDLQRVVFQITEAKTDELSDLQPLVCGRRWAIMMWFFFPLFVCMGVLGFWGFFLRSHTHFETFTFHAKLQWNSLAQLFSQLIIQKPSPEKSAFSPVLTTADKKAELNFQLKKYSLQDLSHIWEGTERDIREAVL